MEDKNLEDGIFKKSLWKLETAKFYILLTMHHVMTLGK